MAVLKAPDTVSVTSTAQRVTGFETLQRYTLRNTGSNNAYYLYHLAAYPLVTALAGTEAELKTALCSEIQPGETIVVGPDISSIDMVAGSDGGSTTVQIECGEIVTATGAIELAVEKATVDTTSVLYDGQGTANALQPAVDWTEYDALSPEPDAIDASGKNAIDIWLVNSSSGQGGTLVVMEASASPATASTVTRITEVAIPATDQVFDVDRASWGLTTATEYAAKQPIRVAVRPNANIFLFTSASDGGTWYARYALHGSV